MADNNDIKQYPFMFSQDQWANKFSPFQGKPIPFPAQYQGVPTDAHGNPIQSYIDAQAAHDAWQPPATAPAVSLNSTPAASGLGPGGQYGDWSQLAPASPGGPSTQSQYAYNLGLGGIGPAGSLNPGSAAGKAWLARQQPGGAPQAAQQQGAGGGGNPIDMNAAYLSALSSPGHVATPGATVAPSAPPSAQSGVLQQFLQNWNQGGGQTQGAGNYNNKGFFNALQGMV
jgi:hypothetical protein